MINTEINATIIVPTGKFTCNVNSFKKMNKFYNRERIYMYRVHVLLLQNSAQGEGSLTGFIAPPPN